MKYHESVMCIPFALKLLYTSLSRPAGSGDKAVSDDKNNLTSHLSAFLLCNANDATKRSVGDSRVTGRAGLDLQRGSKPLRKLVWNWIKKLKKIGRRTISMHIERFKEISLKLN